MWLHIDLGIVSDFALTLPYIKELKDQFHLALLTFSRLVWFCFPEHRGRRHKLGALLNGVRRREARESEPMFSGQVGGEGGDQRDSSSASPTQILEIDPISEKPKGFHVTHLHSFLDD